MEGEEDPIVEIPANEYAVPNLEPAANQPQENNNNNPTRGGAMAEEDLLQKMEELQNAFNRMRAEKDWAAAEAQKKVTKKNLSKKYFMSFLPHYCHSFLISVIPSKLLSFLPKWVFFQTKSQEEK